MSRLLHRAWADYLQPLLRRPDRLQIAALCHRAAADGGRDVLLVTSLNTQRWILPKGWPIDGMDFPQAAAHEAWEEAGVIPAAVAEAVVGSYFYDKKLRGGAPVGCEVRVFAVEVARLADDYPEAERRQREWLAPAEAASRVEEADLAALLAEFATRAHANA